MPYNVKRVVLESSEGPMTDQELIQAVKAAVLRFDPNAQVILYGSRARGDAQPDSDWDFLVLVEREMTRNLEGGLRDALYGLELESGELISTIIHTKEEWAKPLMRATPFYRSVTTNTPQCGEKTTRDLSPEEKTVAQARLDNAKEALDAASHLLDAHHWHGALHCLYYACFRAVSALLYVYGMYSGKHAGTRALFSKQFVASGDVCAKSGAFYDRIFERTIESEYGELVDISAEQVLEYQRGARDFIEEIQAIVQHRLSTAIPQT